MLLSLSPMHRSRHPLVRVLSLLLGLALLGVLLIFGLLVAGVLLLGGGALLVWRYWAGRRRVSATTARKTPPQVLEGEFVVLRRERTATH